MQIDLNKILKSYLTDDQPNQSFFNKVSNIIVNGENTECKQFVDFISTKLLEVLKTNLENTERLVEEKRNLLVEAITEKEEIEKSLLITQNSSIEIEKNIKKLETENKQNIDALVLQIISLKEQATSDYDRAIESINKPQVSVQNIPIEDIITNPVNSSLTLLNNIRIQILQTSDKSEQTEDDIDDSYQATRKKIEDYRKQQEESIKLAHETSIQSMNNELSKNQEMYNKQSQKLNQLIESIKEAENEFYKIYIEYICAKDKLHTAQEETTKALKQFQSEIKTLLHQYQKFQQQNTKVNDYLELLMQPVSLGEDLYHTCCSLVTFNFFCIGFIASFFLQSPENTNAAMKKEFQEAYNKIDQHIKVLQENLNILIKKEYSANEIQIILQQSIKTDSVDNKNSIILDILAGDSRIFCKQNYVNYVNQLYQKFYKTFSKEDAPSIHQYDR